MWIIRRKGSTLFGVPYWSVNFTSYQLRAQVASGMVFVLQSDAAQVVDRATNSPEFEIVPIAVVQ